MPCSFEFTLTCHECPATITRPYTGPHILGYAVDWILDRVAPLGWGYRWDHEEQWRCPVHRVEGVDSEVGA